MNRRLLLFLLVLGFLSVLPGAAFQTSTGYMDAEYYFQGGARLAQGHGFTELILWNYLDDPAGIPHPSHAYWMPAASLLTALGMRLLASGEFSAGRMVFLLIASLIPLLTGLLCFSITRNNRHAWISGCLATFSGFYLAYLTTTDVFGIYMTLGSIFFLMFSMIDMNAPLAGFVLGLVSGLLHLTRADGLIWIALLEATFLLKFMRQVRLGKRRARYASALITSAAGYLCVMGFWMWRNYLTFGFILSPHGSRTLFLTRYDDLYTFPAASLTFQNWLASGSGEILKARLWAGLLNLQTALVVQGEIILFPLILIGIWKLRSHPQVWFGLAAWMATFFVMTFAFPFIGMRGGFFHSGAAFQPLWWAVAPTGLDVALHKIEKRGGRRFDQTRVVFTVGTISILAMLSGIIYVNRVVGSNLSRPIWNQELEKYRAIERELIRAGAASGEVVMVNNPPGYFVANTRPAVAIPYGNVDVVRNVARQYHVCCLVLEFEQLLGAEDLYTEPGDRLGLKYLGLVENARLYRFTDW
jgi:hypothetical protein